MQVRALAPLAIALTTVTAAPALAETYCPSNQGTGYVDFNPSALSATLYLDGTGQFSGGVVLYLTLPCAPDFSRPNRQAWVCVERPPNANPDGPTSLSIETSDAYLLMVATRDSKKYDGSVVVDDFDCLAGQRP